MRVLTAKVFMGWVCAVAALMSGCLLIAMSVQMALDGGMMAASTVAPLGASLLVLANIIYMVLRGGDA